MAEEQNGNIQEIENEEFDTKGLLLDYLSNWKWFVLGVVGCVALGYFYIQSVIPTYRLESSIFLNESSTNSEAMTIDKVNPLLSFKNDLDETELEIIRSSNNLVKVVDSLGLSYAYYREGTLRDTPLYHNNAIVASLDSASLQQLKAPIYIEISNASDGKFDIDVETRFNNNKETRHLDNVALPCDIELSHATLTLRRSLAIPELEGTEKIIIRSPRNVAKQIAQNLVVNFVKKSDKVIHVSYTTDVIARGVDIINAILDVYNRGIIEDRNRAAVQTEAFILDRLVNISDELRDVENRLQAYRQAHNITELQTQSNLNLTLQSNYQSQLADAEADMAVLNDIERIVSTTGTYELLPSAVQDPSIVNSIEQYNLRVTQLHRALEGSTTNSPIVLSMQDDINRQKVRIMQTIVAAKRNLNSRIANIQRLEDQSSGQLASTPTVDKGLQEIFREQQVKVNIYTFLLQRREEIALQKSMTTNSARLIDDPTGEQPVAPRKMLILVGAFILGLIIPGIIIYLRRSLFPRFSDQEELERATKIPVLGEISIADKSSSNDQIVVGENVSTPIAELFRLLRNNISFATHNNTGCQVILLTSSVSGEGKTFVATNLALTYAIAGKKVLVIGADIRRPVLAKRFGLDNRRGLTTYLSGQEKDVDSLLVKSDICPNLYILPAGPVPPNPNELLMSNNMEHIIELLRQKFDYVIIDTAPIGIISDSFLIVRYSDLQLFVTRANYSSRHSLSTLHSAVRSHKLPNAYIVLNAVNMKGTAYSYRHYGTHTGNYSYGYKSHK